jgi:hypothetical protein
MQAATFSRKGVDERKPAIMGGSLGRNVGLKGKALRPAPKFFESVRR